MSSNVKLRPAERSDIPELSRITNDANGKSVAHKRVAPNQDRYPMDYYRWRLNIVRERFATLDLRTMVAEDSTSGKVLGLASWAVEGSDTALYKKWTSEDTWVFWLERQLLWVEKTWFHWVVDRSIDYRFLKQFVAALHGPMNSARPACIHLHLIAVDPHTQSKGVGRVLVDWGKELSAKEDLPISLESNLEAPGFYQKLGFSRMKDAIVDPDGPDPMACPVFVWEPEQSKGRWLERDVNSTEPGERWKWRAEVLPK